MFKVNKDTRTTPLASFWCLYCVVVLVSLLRRSGIFIVNFEHISHIVLVFLLLTLNMRLPAGSSEIPIIKN